MIFRIVANFMEFICFLFLQTIYYSQFSLFLMKSQKLSENTLKLLKLAKYKQRFTIAIVFLCCALCCVRCYKAQSHNKTNNIFLRAVFTLSLQNPRP